MFSVINGFPEKTDALQDKWVSLEYCGEVHSASLSWTVAEQRVVFMVSVRSV